MLELCELGRFRDRWVQFLAKGYQLDKHIGEVAVVSGRSHFSLQMLVLGTVVGQELLHMDWVQVRGLSKLRL